MQSHGKKQDGQKLRVVTLRSVADHVGLTPSTVSAADSLFRKREIVLFALSLQSTHSKPAGSLSKTCMAGSLR